MKGIRVNSIEVGPRGFVNDRHWLVVNASGRYAPPRILCLCRSPAVFPLHVRFVTQRQNARMCLVQPTVLPDGIQLDAPGMPSLRVRNVKATDPGAVVRTVSVWASDIEGAVDQVRAERWVVPVRTPALLRLTLWHHVTFLGRRSCSLVGSVFGDVRSSLCEAATTVPP